MDSLTKHPGYLGFTSRGVIAIHADWPMYPLEHGGSIALESLAAFPIGAEFRVIDDIDQCLLFFVGDPDEVKNPFEDKYFHVAIWHEDVIELFQNGHIKALSGISPDEWIKRSMRAWSQIMREHLSEEDDDFPLPQESDFFDALPLELIRSDGIAVTPLGWKVIRDLMVEERDRLAPEVKAATFDLIKIHRYDTAVREACLLVEVLLRRMARSDSYGQRLIEEAFDTLFRSETYISSSLKVLRGDVRTLFKFVRNEYMHNLKRLTNDQCIAILTRISYVYGSLKSIVHKSGSA
ncbi:MAG: TIGR02391 family protein [Thermoanaerobaculia bacterium]